MPSYWLIVKFDRTIAKVRVSEDIFYKAGRGDLPELYFTDTFHQVYGAWDVRAAFNWFLFSGLGALVCWMPIGKWRLERVERRKAKQTRPARYKRVRR
ncbi:hypothetical protein [Chitinophaga caseinilytica]|uniref:hypothetical protein n=1 Tax=Chitinophaga caseinilytica TaxID=2267521 RepID=UPI003C2C8D95